MTKTAVIGLGKMGLSHLAIANAVPGLEVTAIVDKSILVGSAIGKYGNFRHLTDYDNDFINGGTGDDILVGGNGIDTITFKDGATNGVFVDLTITARYNTGMGFDVVRDFENIEGTTFADTLIGDGGANKILGLGGGDAFRGAGGDDELQLGSGADKVYFDSAATNGVDKIRNFESGVDKLYFRVADGYDAAATLSYDTASGTGAQFIYNTKTQQLFYDADGTGGGAATLLAFLGENPPLVLQSGDIVVI